MNNKKSNTRFTIQFNRTDPKHLRVADDLNKQERYGKAQFIVDAVTFYIDQGGKSDSKSPLQISEKHIETIVNRILQNRKPHFHNSENIDMPAILNHNANNNEQPEVLTKQYETIEIDDNMKELCDDTMSMINNTMEMFRRK
jgi:hypothetical protein